MTTTELLPLILLGGGAFLLIGAAVHFTGVGSLNNIKSKTVGDGQHGTARWATKQEIQKTYRHIPFRPDLWRRGEDLPTAQGLVLGCVGGRGLKKPGKLAEKVRSLWRGKGAPRRKRPKQKPTAKPLWAIVDVDDIHCLMIGASGVGKTAFFLYPNLEYACASGMSFLALDTKGDLARNYGTIASRCYGYQVAVIDLRNPTRSDGYNLLTLINHYMDVCREDEKNLAARAKAEKYAKILAKTIVNPEGDASNYGQNAFFYDAAEGLLTAVILLLAEYLPPTDKAPQERRHIVSVFKLVQDLLAPSKTKGKTSFHILMDKLPDTHKARWFAGAALTTAEQSMNSVMSTVLSRLNAFLDTELEQVLCFDSAINAEDFASKKSAIFLILPEEDPSKNFMAGLMIQTLSRELFAPNSQTAEVLSKALGSRTVMSGYISKGKSDPSQTIQMMERPLMTPDELKSIPKGHFIVMKTGTHPMRTRLRLFLEWGITFGDPYSIPEKTARPVAYASKQELELAIMRRHHVWMPAASGAAPASGKAAAGREPCPKTGQPGDEPPDGQKSLRP